MVVRTKTHFDKLKNLNFKFWIDVTIMFSTLYAMMHSTYKYIAFKRLHNIYNITMLLKMYTEKRCKH